MKLSYLLIEFALISCNRPDKQVNSTERNAQFFSYLN